MKLIGIYSSDFYIVPAKGQETMQVHKIIIKLNNIGSAISIWKKVLPVLFILLSYFCNCQQIEFAKTYSFSGYDEVERFVELADSGFMLVGYASNQQTTNDDSSFVLRLDKFGNVMFERKYSTDRIWGVADKTDSTVIVAGGFITINVYGSHTMDISVLTGDTSNYMYYGYSGIGGGVRINRTSDHGYILCDSYQYDYSYLKVDSVGTVQWHTWVNMVYGVAELKPDPYSNNYVAVGRDDNISPYCVIKLDSIGDTLWRRNYGYYPAGTSDIYAQDVAFMADSNYLVCGDLVDISIIKINKNTGDSIWSKGYPLGWIISLCEGRNDTYVGLGRKIYFFDGNGDTLFTREYPWIFPHFQPRQIRKTKDGGFAYCGLYIPNPGPNYSTQLIALVKMDSLGNTVFTSVFNPENNFQPLAFYPNPAINEININPGTMADEKQLLFTLVDLRGRNVLKQQYDSSKPIDVSILPEGLYIATLKGKEKEVRGKVVVQR